MLNFRVPRKSRERENRFERDVIIGLDLAAAAVMLLATFCIMEEGVPVLLLLLPLHHLDLAGLEDPLLPVIDHGNLAVVHVVFQEMHFDAKLLHFL